MKMNVKTQESLKVLSETVRGMMTDYADEAHHLAHAEFAKTLVDYHEFKARAVRARANGNAGLASGLEARCDLLAKKLADF
jgi:hypothetical protein